MIKSIYNNKNNQNKSQNYSTTYLYTRKQTEATNNNQIMEDDRVEDSWLKIKTKFLNAAKESLSEKTVDKNKNIQKKMQGSK